MLASLHEEDVDDRAVQFEVITAAVPPLMDYLAGLVSKESDGAASAADVNGPGSGINNVCVGPQAAQHVFMSVMRSRVCIRSAPQSCFGGALRPR